MELAPDNASVLLIVSIVSAIIAIGLLGFIVTGQIPINSQDSIDTSKSTMGIEVNQNENEVRFKVQTLSQVDQYVITEPDGTEHKLTERDDEVVLETNDGIYTVTQVVGDRKSIYTTVNPDSNFESTGFDDSDGQLVSQ